MRRRRFLDALRPAWGLGLVNRACALALAAEGGNVFPPHQLFAPIRMLGDAVLRRRAWEVADRLGRDSTDDAEYVALTTLQVDALITFDPALEHTLVGVVETASLSDLR